MKRTTFLFSLLSSVPAWLVPWRGMEKSAFKMIHCTSGGGDINKCHGGPAAPKDGWESINQPESWSSENGCTVGFDPAFNSGDSTFMTVTGYDQNGVMHTETIRL